MKEQKTNQAKLTKRRQRKKELKIQIEDNNLSDLLQNLGEYQNYIHEKNNTWRKFYFNWENATQEYVELREGTSWNTWLYPIKFCSVLAFILETLQHNINDIIEDREKTIKLICLTSKINEENFRENIEKIQDLLIKFQKVKVCKDGKVVMMNDIW